MEIGRSSVFHVHPQSSQFCSEWREDGAPFRIKLRTHISLKYRCNSEATGHLDGATERAGVPTNSVLERVVRNQRSRGNGVFGWDSRFPSQIPPDARNPYKIGTSRKGQRGLSPPSFTPRLPIPARSLLPSDWRRPPPPPCSTQHSTATSRSPLGASPIRETK
jgi:hypothetical protein